MTAFSLSFLLVTAALCILCRWAEEPAAEEDPCETCVRWEECNGVDECCPWKEESRGKT